MTVVRKFPVLYDKFDIQFKDTPKKLFEWEDVAKEANFYNGNKIVRISWLITACSDSFPIVIKFIQS